MDLDTISAFVITHMSVEQQVQLRKVLSEAIKRERSRVRSARLYERTKAQRNRRRRLCSLKRKIESMGGLDVITADLTEK